MLMALTPNASKYGEDLPSTICHKKGSLGELCMRA
jgi:hypothetical protein